MHTKTNLDAFQFFEDSMKDENKHKEGINKIPSKLQEKIKSALNKYSIGE